MPRFLVVLLTVFCAMSPSARAQGATATLRGVIVDETGAAVRGVAISLFGVQSGHERTTTTDDGGSFVMPLLLPGAYILGAQRDGFAPVDIRDLDLRPQDHLLFTIRLRIGPVAESVKVVAQRVWVRDSALGPLAVRGGDVEALQITGEAQRVLPLSPRRDWADFLRLTPGVIAGVDSTGLSRYHWHGSDAVSHLFQIDGADMGSAVRSDNLHITLSPDAIEAVTVKSGVVDASSPLGVGAHVDVTTRSGTNRASGALGLVGQPSAWNSSNVASGTSQSVQLFHAELTGGGPLRPGRWWIFGASHRTDKRLGISRTAGQLGILQTLAPRFQPGVDDSRETALFVKTTALRGSHRLSAFYQHDARPEDANSALNAGRFVTRIFGGTGASARLASTWRQGVTTELSVAFNDKTSPTRATRLDMPSRPVHEQVFASSGALVGTGAIAILDNVSSTLDRPREKLTVTADLTSVPTRFPSHRVTAGVYLQPRLREKTIETFANGGFVLEELVLRDPGNLTRGARPFHRRTIEAERVVTGEVRSRDHAVYVQDTWRPSDKLTLHAGIRADFIERTDDLTGEILRGAPVRPSEPGFDATTPAPQTTVVQQSAEVGPRASVTYRPFDNEMHVIRASWGRTQESPSAGPSITGVNQVRTIDTYDMNLDGLFETTLVTRPGFVASSFNRLFDRDRRQPSVNEWLVGHRWEPGGALAIDASFSRRTYRDRLTLVETNGRYMGGRLAGYENPLFTELYLLTNNTWNWPVHSAFDLQVSHLSARVRVHGTYMRQWRHLDGTWQPNDPASFLQPGAFANERGLGSIGSTTLTPSAANSLSGSSMTGAPQWRDHTLGLSSFWIAPLGLTLATNYTFQSGLWSGPIVTRIVPDPRTYPPTVLIGGRAVSNPLATSLRFAFPTRGEGQFALPSLHAVNVRVGREFRRAGWRLEMALDLLNATNHDADQFLEAGANQLFNPKYGQGRVRQAPRGAQLSLRLAF